MPHSQTTATVNADFDDAWIPSNEIIQVPMVDGKIVLPFPNAMTLSMVLEVLPERIVLVA